MNGYCLLGLFGCRVFFTFCLEALFKEYVVEMQGDVQLHSACVRGVLQIPFQVDHPYKSLYKMAGVVCSTSGVEPTDFVDLTCSLFIWSVDGRHLFFFWLNDVECRLAK